MNLRMGGHLFQNVQIPLLWGKRAVIQDKNGLLSIIDLSGEKAHPEVIGDQPAPDISFRPSVEGFTIRQQGQDIYSYNPAEKQLISIALGLPPCQLTPTSTRVGSSEFSANLISGFGVGIAVTPEGVALGAPLPIGLAKLVTP